MVEQSRAFLPPLQKEDGWEFNQGDVADEVGVARVSEIPARPSFTKGGAV